MASREELDRQWICRALAGEDEKGAVFVALDW